MYRYVAGTCRIELSLTTRAGWMVAGDRTGNRTEPLVSADGRPVLPASGLKGVLRGTAERILRSVQPDRNPSLVPLADVPFLHDEADLPHLQRGEIADSELNVWRGARGEPGLPAVAVYSALSPISQLFGATLHAGLVTVEDATAETRTSSPRTHVALDRFTGEARQGGLYTDALAPAGAQLRTAVTITNFALWHLGLLALVFQEIDRGYAAIGAGTRKGQGTAKIDVPRVVVRYPGALVEQGGGIVSAQARLAEIAGLDADLPADARVERETVLVAGLPRREPADWRDGGLVTVVAEGEDVLRLFTAAVRDAWLPWLHRRRSEGG
jgi:CRISPR/Cas system CSM-associated protein Csm3 (group 7 of RAMP superfamily)